MTDTKWRTIEPAEPVDFSGVAEMLQRQGERAQAYRQKREAELEAFVQAGEFTALCPPKPEACTGYATPDDELWDIRCPAKACPHQPARIIYHRHRYLESVGFDLAAWDPEWERVPNPIRIAAQVYCNEIGKRLASGDGLVISGVPGCGKTNALALIALAALEKRTPMDVPWVVVSEATTLFRELRDDEDRVFEGLQDVDLWLLEDLGSESRAWAAPAFGELLDYRWANRMSVVISTNLNERQMSQDTDLPRAFSRLRDRNPYVWTDAPSQRKQARVQDWFGKTASDELLKEVVA